MTNKLVFFSHPHTYAASPPIRTHIHPNTHKNALCHQPLFAVVCSGGLFEPLLFGGCVCVCGVGDPNNKRQPLPFPCLLPAPSTLHAPCPCLLAPTPSGRWWQSEAVAAIATPPRTIRRQARYCGRLTGSLRVNEALSLRSK